MLYNSNSINQNIKYKPNNKINKYKPYYGPKPINILIINKYGNFLRFSELLAVLLSGKTLIKL